MSYDKQFYLETELEEEELTEEDDIEDTLDDDLDDDSSDIENDEDFNDDNESSENNDEDGDDEPHPMTYDDLEQYSDYKEDESEDDISDFGSDDSDVNNDYDPKDVEMLNKLISSETSAIQEYLDADKETSDDILHRLYADIANEERFHIEQLMYAKAKLTGEKYEPSDPEVKREYEELLNTGMDEESAMSTACDKCNISHDKYYTSDSISDIIDDINDFTESFVESAISNLALSSFENTQDVYMEYADALYMEAIQNASDRNIQNETKIHPIKFIINVFFGILKFIRKMIKRIREFLRKIHIKDQNKIRWIKKHGIKALFKEGIWLYMWSDEGNHMSGITTIQQYLDLFGRIMNTIRDSMYNKKEAPPIQQAIYPILRQWNIPPIRYKSIDDGVNIIRNVVFSKEKVIITDSNELELERMFFGISDDHSGRRSNNIYNWMDSLVIGFDKLGEGCEKLLEQLKDLEGNYDSAYGKNPKLYNNLISATKALSNQFTKFSKVVSHDVSAVMNLNTGLFELMKEYDESKKTGEPLHDGFNEDIQRYIKRPEDE